MSTATRVPETARMPGEELDASDARTALRRFGRRRLAVESGASATRTGSVTRAPWGCSWSWP